jgi:acetyl-CoA carboxylase biotin carboxyl carrier protein
MDIDLERLTALMRLMDENDLAELEVESGEFKVRLRKRGATAAPTAAPPVLPPPAAARPAGPSPAAPAEDLIEITSPMVGTFYRAPAPDADPYVRVGDLVHEDTVICVIEAMKVMNEIKAETEGAIVEVKVDNGEAVEFGQVLFTVRPSR